jgi:ubiquinone/menaquinone biosynthesis C-methylase UbiE
VLVWPHTKIPVTAFDGEHLPFPDKSVDVVMFVYVLHHTNDPEVLLREAQRVALKAVVLKDHTRNGLLAYTTLRFMDWVGMPTMG